MCDFISWVEYDDGIFFLTDAQVLSSEGRKLFKDCQDNDVLGHGAIRRYYSLESYQGTDGEQRNFWETKTLPEPLKSLLATPEKFIQVWGRMFKEGVFQNDDLRYIIEYAPEPYKRKAHKILTER